MHRTLVNLDPDDKAWLDREAKSRHVPMTELVRQAVRAYRIREESHGQQGLQHAIRETAGVWHDREDGLDVQQRLRDEWDER